MTTMIVALALLAALAWNRSAERFFSENSTRAQHVLRAVALFHWTLLIAVAPWLLGFVPAAAITVWLLGVAYSIRRARKMAIGLATVTLATSALMALAPLQELYFVLVVGQAFAAAWCFWQVQRQQPFLVSDNTVGVFMGMAAVSVAWSIGLGFLCLLGLYAWAVGGFNA